MYVIFSVAKVTEYQDCHLLINFKGSRRVVMAFAWKSTKILVALAGIKANRILDFQSTKNCHQEDGLFFVSNDPFQPPSYLKSPVLH